MAGLSISAPQYAPATDLNAYLAEAVAGADGLLQEASATIRNWTKTAFYRVEPDDTPSPGPVADALHDAAVLQAAAMHRAGLRPGDTLAASTDPRIQAKSLGARSVTYVVDASQQVARAALLEGYLTPQAGSILSAAGLLSTNVHTGGYADYDILARRWVVG